MIFENWALYVADKIDVWVMFGFSIGAWYVLGCVIDGLNGNRIFFRVSDKSEPKSGL